MEHRRERFQADLAEAWNDWDHDAADLARKASDLKMLTGTDLSGGVARLYAHRATLRDELDALLADPDDASLDRHAARVERALQRFDRTFADLSTRTESIYDKTVRGAMAKRTGRQ